MLKTFQMRLNMNTKEIDKIKTIIHYTLIKIGFRVDLVGFNYLSSAIEIAISLPNETRNLCKGIYAIVAKKFNTPGSSVEKSIRHSIDDTFQNKTFVKINEMFNMNIFSPTDKPTAGELIKLIAEYYNLEIYKKDMLKN